VQVLKEKVKEKIYQAAVEEFYKKGYLKAKMQDIAKKAGISVGLTYSYYNRYIKKSLNQWKMKKEEIRK